MKLFNKIILGLTSLSSIAFGVLGADIASTLVAEGNFGTLVTAALAADLGGALSDPSSTLTVLAPTDAAFANIDSVVQFLLVDNDYTKKLLTDVLLYHVIGQELDSSTINGDQSTLLGKSVNVAVPSVNGGAATITKADISADGGIIHEIDAVLVPEGLPLSPISELAVNAGLGSLVSALSGVGAVSTFASPGVYTVFAPTDAAFEKFFNDLDADLDLFLNDDKLRRYLGRILNAHVVANEALLLADVVSTRRIKTLSGRISNKAIKPVTTDVLAINGVVHVVDEVIVTRICTAGLNSAIRKAKRAAAEKEKEDQDTDGDDDSDDDSDDVASDIGSIVDIASSTSSLSTLVLAASSAGLVPALDADSAQLTVFAPTNEAFAAEELADILPYLLGRNDYAKSLLTDLLLFHVLDEKKTAADLALVSSVTTLNDDELPVDIANLVVNGDAPIITPNIEADNGIVHTVGKVLIPPSFPTKTITGLAVSLSGTNGPLGSLVAVLSALDLAATFDVQTRKTIYTVFAPTDQAFADLLAALNTDLDTILGDRKLKSLLKSVVKLHYVKKNALDSTAVTNASKVRTAGGKIAPSEFILPNLVIADAKAINGIVHVINKVIVTPKLAKKIQKRLAQLAK